jgi:hypothetical protein
MYVHLSSFSDNGHLRILSKVLRYRYRLCKLNHPLLLFFFAVRPQQQGYVGRAEERVRLRMDTKGQLSTLAINAIVRSWFLGEKNQSTVQVFVLIYMLCFAYITHNAYIHACMLYV